MVMSALLSQTPLSLSVAPHLVKLQILIRIQGQLQKIPLWGKMSSDWGKENSFRSYRSNWMSPGDRQSNSKTELKLHSLCSTSPAVVILRSHPSSCEGRRPCCQRRTPVATLLICLHFVLVPLTRVSFWNEALIFTQSVRIRLHLYIPVIFYLFFCMQSQQF